MYKTCEKCGRPMISAEPVCYRASCRPNTKQVQRYVGSASHGKNGRRERQLSADRGSDRMRPLSAPVSACFYFWAVPPSSWPILQVAVDTIKEMRRSFTGWVSRPRDARGEEGPTAAPAHRVSHTTTARWLGLLSNAAQKHCHVNVVYRAWDVIRECIHSSDDTFARQMVTESLRGVAARDSDYAADLEYARSNYELYSRDKAVARA